MSNLISSSQFPKKESIEYFMKKDSSPSDTNLLREQERKCQNEMVPNQCGQAKSSSECLEKEISESPGHYCPICDRKCPKDLRLFNAHIDKCLLQQSGANDRKMKRVSPVVTNADFEDFLEFSTIKASRKSKTKIKMTQKNLKTVFEESLVRNGIPSDFCLEKSSECKYENLSEAENVPQQRKDSKKTGVQENSSEIEHKESNSVILESCVNSETLKNRPFSDGVTKAKEESCPHENKSISPSVSKLVNSKELSGCEKPSPKSAAATANTSGVSELNDTDMEQILTKFNGTKEESMKVDGIDLVEIHPENITSPSSKHSRKQSDCDNKENATDCSSADIANSTVQTKLKNLQNNKSLKKTLRNCNLLKYFSKSNVNKRGGGEEVNQCLSSNESWKWSESTNRVVEKTAGSMLDETICSEQKEVDVGGLLNKEDITDQQQQWTVAETNLVCSVVSDKLQKQVDSEQDISLVTDKLQQEVETGQDNSLVVEKVQQIVETSWISSLACGKLQKEVTSGQRINLAGDKPQKEVDSGQKISLVTEKIQKLKTGQGRSLADDKLETGFQTDQEVSQDSKRMETRDDCGQGRSSNVTGQLQKVFNSSQSHRPANTDQTDCSISHSHSTENSFKTSDSIIKVDTSHNHGDCPNNKIVSSCAPQCQEPSGYVNIDTQFHSSAKTTSELPQDKEFPTRGDNCQTMQLVHQCPICNSDIPLNDMSIFNEHVDLCLNQATIKRILLEQGEELKNSAKHKRLVCFHFLFSSVLITSPFVRRGWGGEVTTDLCTDTQLSQL